MRRPRTIPSSLSLAFACVWLLGRPTPSALAQSSLQYEAPGTCPGREAFLERVQARLRVDGTRMPAELVLRVTLAASGAGTHGVVELRRGATKTQRSVDAARCQEVVEALALITALAVSEQTHESRRERVRKPDKSAPRQPDTTRASAPAPTLPTPSPVAESSGTTTAAPAPAAESSAAATATPAPAAESSATATATPAPAAESSATTTAAPAPAPAAESGATKTAASSWQFTASTAAAFVAFTGLAPALQPGLQLRAAFGFTSGALAWSLHLGARMARQDRLVSPDGEAFFGFASGVVSLCGSSALGSTRVTLSGCAVAEPGVFTTGAEDTTRPRSYARAWLALGAAAHLSLGLTSWLSLQAGVELLAPVRRDRMSLAGDTLYRVPRLGSRLQIGVEIPFG